MEFVCLSIASRMDLRLAARLFGLPLDTPWRECLRVGSTELDSLLSTGNPYRKLYLFRSGCVVFKDFGSSDMLAVIKLLDANITPVQYQQMAEYREALKTEQLALDEEAALTQLEATVPFYLEKSVELNILLTELNRHLECEEVLIERLRQGKRWLHLRYTSTVRQRLILFQCRALSHANLLENRVRVTGGRNQALRDRLDEMLGLAGRTQAFHAKMENLNALLARFSSEKHAATMVRFFRYEVYLLAVFPLLHIIPPRESLLRGYERLLAWLTTMFH